MDIKNFINNVSNQIKYEPIRKEISDELETHMQELKEDYIKDGVENEEAEKIVISQMGDAEKIGKNLNKIHKPKLDWKLFWLILILIGFNIIVSIQKQNIDYMYKTILYIIDGILLGMGMYFFDYKKIKKYSNILYVIAFLVMIIPMINYNGTICFRIFNIKFMPCILAVPLYIIAFVGNVTNYNTNKLTNIKINKYKSISKLSVLTFISLLTVSLVSISNAIMLSTIYLIISIAQMTRNKEKKSEIQFLVNGIVLFILVILGLTTLMNGRLILNNGLLFKEERDYNDLTVKNVQREVLKNAKLIGESNIKEILNNESIIYEQSQYAFIYLIGKVGIIPSLILVFAIILIAVRLLIDAKNIDENYGKLLIIGLGMLYICQSTMNIFMNLNIGVITDVNLPFITNGAIYFIVNILCMSIILSVYRRKDINSYNMKNKSLIREIGQILICMDKKLMNSIIRIRI